MKKIIITAVCVIASFAFGTKAQSQNVIDEFPYETGTITSSAELAGWTFSSTGATISSGGVKLSRPTYYDYGSVTSPELKGYALYSVSITVAATPGSQNLLYAQYSSDGTSFSPQNYLCSGATTTTNTVNLPWGTRFVRIRQEGSQGANATCTVTSITITNTQSFDTVENITLIYKESEVIINGTGNMPNFESASQTPWYSKRETIKKLTIANSITSISNYAFSGCTGLTSINAPAVTSIGYSAFRGCTGLTAIEIPSNVKEIGDYAFDGCTGLTSLYIPNATTKIGNYAFRGMINLDYVLLGTGLKTVGDLAFSGCSILSTVEFNATDCRTFGANVFQSSLVETFFFGSNVKTIPARMFADVSSNFRLLWQDGQGVGGSESVFDLVIPPSIKTICEQAFLNNDFTEIRIPASVDTIEAEAFRNNKFLSELYCERATPPALKGNLVFHNINKGDCLLIVPTASYNAYASAAQWKDFIYIVDASYTNAMLKNIAINGSNVEDFDAGVYTYSLTVPYSVSSITLNAEAAAAGSTVEGVGTFDLNVGLNVFVITVTAADGVSTSTYTMGITRSPENVGVEGLAGVAGSDGGLRFNNPVTDGQLRLFGFDPASAVEIYDLNGRKMYESRSGSDVISVAGLTRGVYVVKNGKQIAKLVKQ